MVFAGTAGEPVLLQAVERPVIVRGLRVVSMKFTPNKVMKRNKKRPSPDEGAV